MATMRNPSHGESEAIELTTRYSYDKDENDFDSPTLAVSRGLLEPESSQSTLVDDEFVDVESTLATKWKATPIPKLQLFTLCAVRIVDPIRHVHFYHHRTGRLIYQWQLYSTIPLCQ